MPIMTKMRDNMPVILIGLVVVFLITIVFEWGMDYLGIRSGRRDTVGAIEGRKITYQEFSDLVKRASDQQKQQTGQDPDEDMLRQIREQVWNSLVTQTLVDKETERAGIKVTDQEIVDWVRGPNPPEFLVQQFKDSTGRFNRAAYESAINDPRNRDIWIQVESALKQQRLAEKMQSLILATVRVTPGEVMERYVDQNEKIDAQYALYDPNRYVPDSAVTVTDDDLRKFYNEHQEEFKTKATRRLKYVIFSGAPSSQDTADVLDEFKRIREQLKAGIDFLEIQKSYSEGSTAPAFFKHGELSPEKEKAVFAGKVGDVIGPVKDFDGFHLFKILDEKRGGDTFVKASHILLNIPSPADEAEVMKKAREIAARARKGEDFASLARQFSQEPGAAQTGGELGWFGKGRMVKPFEDAAMKGRPGEIVGPVKTQFGLHIIKIEAKDNRELKVADIRISIKASSQTKDAAYQNAQDFSYLAKKEGKFEQEAEGLNLPVRETPPFQKGGMIPGLGFNDAVGKFAFANDVGEVSDVFEVNGGYAVFKVSEVKKDGVRPLDEVKDFLKPRVLREKKMAVVAGIAAKVRAGMKEGDDLATLTASDPLVSVQTTGEFTPGGSVPTVGRENSIIGAATVLPIGKISEPIEGIRGCYLIKVISRTPVDTASFNAQKTVLEAQLLQEKKQRALSAWLEKLKEKADIEDNRDLFYR